MKPLKKKAALIVDEAAQTATLVQPDAEDQTEAPTEEADTEIEAAIAKAIPVSQSAVASISPKKGWLKFTMYDELRPPPVIGHCDVGRLLGVDRLSAKTTYLLPPNVVEVLLDAKKGCLGS